MHSMGCMGLTCILEAACLLALSARDKIITFHVPLCAVAGLAFTLVSFNISRVLGAAVGAVTLCFGSMSIIFHFACFPDEDSTHPKTCMSVLFWVSDAWIILGRLLFLFFPVEGWVDHFWFDLVSLGISAAFLCVLALLVGLVLCIGTEKVPWLRRLLV